MKMHVLVRKDLPWSQRAVQAAHAVAKYIQNYDVWSWNQHLIIHAVRNKSELMAFYGGDLPLPVALFTEPDMDDEATALAFLGSDEKVKELPLL